jgi:hypothetical protein
MTATTDTLTIRRAEYEYQREKLAKALADLANARDEVEKWRTAAHVSQRETQRYGARVEEMAAQLADAERTIRALANGEAHWKALYEAERERSAEQRETEPVESPPAPPTHLVPLPFGVLPKQSALVLPCRRINVTPAHALSSLRDMVRMERFDIARQMLNALGFDWLDKPLPSADMQEAVDSVAAALDDEVTT